MINGNDSRSGGDGYLEKTVITNYLLTKGIRKIDLLILSSINKDHLNGAVHLTNKFYITELLTNGEKLIGTLWENINNKEIKWASLSEVHNKTSFGDMELEVVVA